jgi:hypothetical protein
VSSRNEGETVADSREPVIKTWNFGEGGAGAAEAEDEEEDDEEEDIG